MNNWYIVYGIIIFLVVIFVFICILLKQKLRKLNYKVSRSENKILSFLEDKKETLNKLKGFLEFKKIEIISDDIINLDFDEKNLLEIDYILSKNDSKIFETFEYNVNIKFSEEELYLFSKHKNINVEMTGIKKYYNKNVAELNKTIKKFPANIIAKILKIKPKELFEIKKEEILPLLKS